MTPAEERLRVSHEVLIERVVLGHEHAERALAAAPAASRLLPGAGDGTRVSGQHRGVEVANVYAQLHRVGRGQSEEFTLVKIPLDASAIFRHITGAVGGDTSGDDWVRRLELVSGVHVQKLRLPSTANERHRARVSLEQLDVYLGRLGVGGATCALGEVDHGRVPQGEVLSSVW